LGKFDKIWVNLLKFWVITQNLGKIKILHPQKHSISYGYTLVSFYKNNFIRKRAHFFSKFKNKLRTIPASAEEQSLKFSIKVVNKTATSRAQLVVHFASRFSTYNC